MALLRGIFVEHYGRLGRKSRQEWKLLLASNRDLFAKISSAVNAVGPNLDSQGKVIGDTLSIEYTYFLKYASTEQQEFYEELEKVNPAAAREYLLTITNALELWKRDVRWLQLALYYLKKEERILKQEAAVMQQKSQQFPQVIKRHFPQLFSDLEFSGLNVEEMLQKIKKVLTGFIEPEEKYLEDYLLKLQLEMPFLFERD